MGFVASVDVEPIPVVVREGERWLELGSVTAELPTRATGRPWVAPLEGPVAGVEPGSRWVVLGDDGSRSSCTVTGLVRAADDAEGYGSEADPTCGGWIAFASLSCEGGAPVGGVALPGRWSSARAFAPTPAPEGARARAQAVVTSDPAWLARWSELSAAGRAPTVEVEARVHGLWTVGEVELRTGPRWRDCGSDEVFERWLVVLDAQGEVVWSPRRGPDPWDASPTVVGVYDLENDGFPELRIVEQLQRTDLMDRAGAVRAHLPVRFCGCPC